MARPNHRWIGSEDVCSKCGKDAAVYIAELEAENAKQRELMQAMVDVGHTIVLNIEAGAAIDAMGEYLEEGE